MLKKLFISLASLFLTTAVFAQSKNFEGFGLALDYSLNIINNVSTPGGSVTSKSGIPGATFDFYKAISDKFLIGAYGTLEFGTTDTTGTDPDAHHPYEAGLKAGYALNQSLMTYIKVGRAWSKYSSPGYYQWMDGMSYGLGLDYFFTKNIFTRAELSQQNYESVLWDDGSKDKVRINAYTLSIGYRF
jgi:opacity protein-like surface antigen